MKAFLTLTAIACVGAAAGAGTTIDPTNHFAFAANLGWLDARGDTSHGAVIGEYVCSGFLYSANAGWISLGGGAPADGVYYQNTSSADFGVNQDGLGNLRGLAYGANVGWISFEDTGAPQVDLRTGLLSGSVWSANCGWISLSNSAALVQTDSIQQGALAPDGLPIAWPLLNFGTTDVTASADPDGDGMTNQQEYEAGTDPHDPNSNLKITAYQIEPATGGVSLTWTSVPTRFYQIQKTLSLSQGSWADSGLGVLSAAGSSTSAIFFDTNAPASFYRVQALRPLMP